MALAKNLIAKQAASTELVSEMWTVRGSLCSLLARPPLGFELQVQDSREKKDLVRQGASVATELVYSAEEQLRAMVFLTVK